MARCYCRWRNVLICLCTPCILLALLVTYITLMVCFNMARVTTTNMKATVWKPRTVEITHFIAQGVYRNEGLAPLPKTFWDLHPHNGGFWNRLQQVVDRYYNPILSPRNNKRGYKRTKLKESLSAVGNVDNVMSKLPQQMQEFASYMHRREYPVLIEPHMACGAGTEEEKEPPLLLLAIKTRELNFQNRQAIRQSWGQVGWVAGRRRNESGGGEGGGGAGRKGGGYVRRVFLLGRENYEELGVDMSELLHLESKHYRDILQWDFKDSFFNLTLKDVLFWSWFSRFCNQTRFVFKGDDDVFVNTPAMVDYLQDQLGKPGTHAAMRSFMVGDVIDEAKPNRINNSKYFVPDSFYKGLYPTYAGGGGVVYSGLLTKHLNHMSKKVHLFPIDDVYVGMCMIRLKAFPIHHHAFLTFDFPEKEEKEPCAYHRILLVHKRNPSQVVKLWAELKETQTQCWNVTLRDSDKKEDAKKKKPLIKNWEALAAQPVSCGMKFNETPPLNFSILCLPLMARKRDQLDLQ
ncbi:N-acetyllactosaminide beta-1,3-N-acetylglucosaminyltransferase 2 [Polymixia lowei]